MVLVPLGIDAYKRDSGLIPEVQCYNFYLEKDGSGISPDGTLRIQRPGLTEIISPPVAGPIRAIAYDPGTSYVWIMGHDRVYKGTNTSPEMGLAEIGDVSPSDDLGRIVVTQLTIAILSAGVLYLCTDGSTLITVDLPDDAPSSAVTDIEQINGYILVLFYNGKFYWIPPGETTIGPLNFATAESSNDYALAIRQVNNEFWIAGGRTLEPWQPTGDLDSPFQPVLGRVIPHGCVAGQTVQRFDNTLVWVADDCNVMRIGGVAEIISTPAITERIRQYVRDRGALSLGAWTFPQAGHSFYVLTMPSEGSFVFDAATTAWCKWGTNGETYWLPHVGDSLQGKVLAGSAVDGSFWVVTPDAQNDAGDVFDRIVTGTVPIIGKPPRNDSLSVGVGASEDTEVRIRYRDGQEDYPEDYYDILEVRAPYDICSLYRLGAPQQPYREVEISFVGDVAIRVAGCLANQSWQ